MNDLDWLMLTMFDKMMTVERAEWSEMNIKGGKKRSDVPPG